MKSLVKIRRCFWSSVVLLLLMSASILFMPLVSDVGETNGGAFVITGVAFWGFAIAGYAMLIVANIECKRFLKNREKLSDKIKQRPGIAVFFANIPAVIADVTAIVSLLVFMIINFTEQKYGYISYLLLFILIFSLNMHCLFNGRIYKTTKIKRTRRVNSDE